VKGDVVYLIGGRLPGHRAPRGFVTCSRRPGRREVRARTSIPRILASGFNRIRIGCAKCIRLHPRVWLSKVSSVIACSSFPMGFGVPLSLRWFRVSGPFSRARKGCARITRVGPRASLGCTLGIVHIILSSRCRVVTGCRGSLLREPRCGRVALSSDRVFYAGVSGSFCGRSRLLSVRSQYCKCKSRCLSWVSNRVMHVSECNG